MMDAALDSILKASGSALKHYTMPQTIYRMREAIRKVMAESCIAGSYDSLDVMKNDWDNA